MGRGQIISGGTNGQYQVKLIYAYRSRIDAKILRAQQNITAIEAQIVTVEAAILAETDPKKKADLVIQKSVLNLQIASLNKEIAYYQTKMPADPTLAAWCADLTEDLTGNVGTIEIPGEPTTVLVRPGYSGRAVYSASRDGQLMPAIAGEPYQVLFNWMLLPGWQRHEPIYRAGTIAPDSLDYDANTCSVCLDAAYSSQLSLPAIDGGTITDCEMGDDAQATYLTESGEDFCSRNPGHPFCIGGVGSEINLTDAMLAQLQEANHYVNAAFGRQTDQSGRRVGDQWDLMVTPGVDSGDCEDFALTKMDRLVNHHGWNPDNLKLVTAYAANGEYHAMLGVRTTNRGLVILDNNYEEVMESGRVPYRLDKIALASDSWANYSRRLDNVPIEYMGCNAYAFADGDRVVVQFGNQSWNEPKVVGFLENPQSCSFDAVVFGNDDFGTADWSHWLYHYDEAVWQAVGDVPGNTYGGEPNPWVIRQGAFTTGDGSNFNLFGGLDTVHHDSNCAPSVLPECASGCRASIYDRSDKYSKNTASWSSLQDMTNGRAHGQSFRIGRVSYVPSGSTMLGFGMFCDPPAYLPISRYLGGGAQSETYGYDEVANTWSAKMDHPTARIWGVSFDLGGIGFSFGGYLSGDISYGDLYTLPDGMRGYNSIANIWAAYQSMSRGRMSFGGGKINNLGMIFGGSVYVGQTGDDAALINGQPGFTTKWIEAFNQSTDSWSNIHSMSDSSLCGDVAECGTYALGSLYRKEGKYATWGKFDALTNSETMLADMANESTTRDTNLIYLSAIAAN